MWIPLGAGQRVVQASGKTFEALSAAARRRPTCDLYHSALRIVGPEGVYVIEMAPIPDAHGERRGVVAEGPVGLRHAADFACFGTRSAGGRAASSRMRMRRHRH
jgi:hypothetical protein